MKEGEKFPDLSPEMPPPPPQDVNGELRQVYGLSLDPLPAKEPSAGSVEITPFADGLPSH